MTTLHAEERKQHMRISHHPGRYPAPDPEREAAWRAERRRQRLLRVMFILSWVSFVGLLVAIYVRTHTR